MRPRHGQLQRKNVSFWATVYETVHLYAVGPLSCLSVTVTLVYCGQTVGWIKMPLGTEVGLGTSDVVLDGDPASPPKRDTAPNFRLMSVAYLHAKFHLDPSNRLATVHERHRQDRTDRQTGQTDNGPIA